MITFYDLAGNDKVKAWSPNTWKTRYVLNMKKLPYQTIFVEFPDVDGVIKEAGIPHSRIWVDGRKLHTVPSIIDDQTGAAISDSFKIAEYLDKQYPDTPKAFPPGTEGLQAAFYKQFNDRIRQIIYLVMAGVPKILTDTSKEYFYRTRPIIFGKPVDEMRPVGEELENTWKSLEAFLDEVADWYSKTTGPFLVGNEPSFADFTIGAMVQAVKLACGGTGEEETGEGKTSEDWERLKNSSNGRWVQLLSDLEKYSSIEN